MNIQYLGFEQILECRTYSFRVVETLKQDREYQLSVETRSLAASKFKFQDIPDLCFSMLKRDLAIETEDQIVPLRRRVSEADLKHYIEDHYPSKQKRS
ncbi:MAG: hypothetical protein L0387_12815 [Acidobacteria bacterium]|nr:hypothetical protein [Acidobacteriota bacterium]MCI0622521.1 hypothetical protein [Acidobacteriota bacterium]MCI0723004.1 hypothetical protein [Acidobacteriota bacterium]